MATEKIKVLISDHKGLFSRMFGKELTEEFDIITNSSLVNNQVEMKDFDRLITVVYNKLELRDFLEIEEKKSNILVCLFNKRLYTKISFIEEINDLIVLDGYKTKKRIVKDLKSHLKKASQFQNPQAKSVFSNYGEQMYFHRFFKTVFLLV